MNNRYLRIFVAVYDHMNMTLAAESLFISQPSVSQAIREMEDHYGTRLFERYPKKLYPTPEGDLLYAYARQILGLYSEAEEEIQFLSDRVTLRVGANISAGTVLIRKYINRFHETNPDVKIAVKVSGSSKLKKMIMDHEIDFAIMEDSIFDTNLIQEPFYHDRIVLVAAPENPLSGRKNLQFSDLRDSEFLLREKGVGVRDKFDYLMMLNDISIEPLWESSNTRALINAVKEDYGIAVLPYLLVEEEIRSGQVCVLDLQEDSLNRNLNIVYHKDKIFNRWTEELIQVIRSMENITAES